jgi:hypothetical protein
MSITVLLLIALCLLCVVVFLKHNRQKETFFQETCETDITCPSGTSLHIVNLGTPDEKKACCRNEVNSNGYYLLVDECVQCTALSGTENSNYLNSFTTTSSNDDNKNFFKSSNNSTIATCRAQCKNRSDYAPHKAAVEGVGWNKEGAQDSSYDTSFCSKSYAYSNVYSNSEAHSNLTIRYQTADTHAPNYENSWCSKNSYSKNNSNYYCCTDSNIPRYNSYVSPNYLGCCASNEYLSNDGSCSSCPNGGLCYNDLNQSGILCCQISNCMLSNSPNSTLSESRDALWSDRNLYYSNNIDVTNISNYGCYAHYIYNQLSNITNGNGSNIVSSSNTIYFDGSNYNYLGEDQDPTSNNIIGSSNIRTSNDLNWFYHHDNNNNEIISNIDIPERKYIPSEDNYSKYYKCNTNTFLRCLESPPSEPTLLEATPSCGCCPSTQHWDGSSSSCATIDDNTQTIDDTQLYPVNLENCLSGYGKSNFDGNNTNSNVCTKCSNLVYYNNSAKNMICQACPDGEYPNGMDAEGTSNTGCSNAPSLTLPEKWYRFEYTASPTYYLTYTSNESNYSIFEKVADSNFTYKDNSNIYLWSNDTDKVKIQLPKTTHKSGQFLNIAQSILSSGHYNTAAEFKPIPYCEPGQYASNNSCFLCPAGTWSSNYGIENESDCQPCPANRTSPEGSTSSDACECDSVSGYFQSAAGSCQQCLADYYLDNGTCQQCPGNTTSPAGSTSSDACECDPGNYYNGSSCVICPINKYCPGGSITGDGLNNHSCIDNSSSDQGSVQETDCQCNPGFYDISGNWLGGGPCQECPSNYYCEGGTTNSTSCLAVRPSSRSLPGSSNGDQCKCKEGHYLTTIFGSLRCAVTENPYYSPNYDNERHECPPNTTIGSGGSSAAECV